MNQAITNTKYMQVLFPMRRSIVISQISEYHKTDFLSVLNWEADLLKRFFKKNVNNYVIIPV